MSFLPRDFLETPEGLVFAVVDGQLEDERVLSFLRYAPQDGSLEKVATDVANHLLRADFPHYLHYSRRLQADLHAVPLSAIQRHHRPRDRAGQILQHGPRDALEAKLYRLLQLLIDGGVAPTCLGVTGSVLIRRQKPQSDLDVVVYGREAFFQARAVIAAANAAGHLAELDESAWQETYQRRGCALDFADYCRHERRKANKGCVDGSKFDLALAEETAPPDPLRWRKVGRQTIRAQVLSDAGAFSHPARYAIDHPRIGDVLSFTHTYVGQAQTGEAVEAAGIVEEAENGAQRLIIGSSREAPGEYLRVLW